MTVCYADDGSVEFDFLVTRVSPHNATPAQHETATLAQKDRLTDD